MLEILSVICIFCLLWFFKWKSKNLLALAKEIESEDKTLPLLGHAYHINKSTIMEAHDSLGEQASRNKHGMVGTWIANQLVVTIADPQVASILMKTCLSKGYIAIFTKKIIGNGLAFAPVQIWRPYRKALMPLFSQTNLLEFLKVFDHQSDVLVDCLAGAVGKGDFSVLKYFTLYSYDSGCGTILGVPSKSQEAGHHQVVDYLEKYCKISVRRAAKFWLYFDFVYKWTNDSKIQQECIKYLHKFADDVIRIKKMEIEARRQNQKMTEKQNKLKTLLDTMIQNTENSYTDVELRDQALTVLFAGVDTTATSLSFLSLLLGQHPEIQQRLYDEIQEVFGNDTRITHEKLKLLKYMEAYILETLRLYPPGPYLYRYCDRDVEMPSGVTLVKGCHCVINVWVIHRNKQYWGADAEKFNPDRFLNGTNYAYLTFAVAPRNCIGYQYAMMSMKTVLMKMLCRYRVVPANVMAGQLGKPLSVKFGVTLKHTKRFMIQLEERQ